MLSFHKCNKLSLVLCISIWNSHILFKLLQINIYKGINIFILSRKKANDKFTYQDVRFYYNKSYNVGEFNEVIFVGLNLK
jgi:hypothetical protein